MTSTCAEACVICDIDGFSGINDLTAMGQGFDEFCTTEYNNMQFIAFTAGSVNLTIEVDVGICSGGINSLEVGLFESLDCENFTPISPCDTDIPSNTTQGFTTDVPLTIGQYYYLVIDGSNGANCNWTFNVIEGSTAASVIATSGTITFPTAICAVNPSSFSTTEQIGASSYQWSVDGVSIGTTTEPNIDISFPEDADFEVCVIASNVCEEGPPSCVNVTVHTPGALSIVEELCEDECITVNGIEYCETGSYQDVITLVSGCDSTINIDLVILETAMTDLTALICNDTSFTVGDMLFNIEGLYEVTVLTAAACDSIVTLDLTVIECEIILTPEEIPVICNGTATGTLVFSVDQGEPPLTWTYTNIADPSITGTGMTNLLIDNEIPNLPIGTYNIYVSDNFGNDAVTLQEITEPEVLVSELTPSLINGFNLSCAEQMGIPGNDGNINITSVGGIPPYSYQWSDGQSGPNANDLIADTYEVTVIDAVGCEQIESLTLTAPPAIEPFIEYINPNCDGLETGIVTINAVVGGTPPFQYSLNGSNFQSVETYTGLSEGDYSVQILDDNGCIFMDTSAIFAPQIPVILALDDVTVSLGCEVQILPELNIAEFLNISWIDNSTLDCENCLTPFAKPFNTTNYTLQVTSIDDCSTKGTVQVSVAKERKVYIPNVFTPNDDGINDRFTVLGGKQVKEVSLLEIYDRWGERVFQNNNFPLNDLDSGWDGKFKRKRATTGVYSYITIIEFLDGESFPFYGEVLLTR